MFDLKHRVTQVLRGRYSSVRYRFYLLPREWLIYLFGFRLFGRKRLEFYAWRMDKSAEQGSHKPVPKVFFEMAREQFDYICSCSALHHMPESDIRIFLKNLKRLIGKDSQFFFIFTPTDQRKFERLRIKMATIPLMKNTPDALIS
jgi:hypothetical protein